MKNATIDWTQLAPAFKTSYWFQYFIGKSLNKLESLGLRDALDQTSVGICLIR